MGQTITETLVTYEPVNMHRRFRIWLNDEKCNANDMQDILQFCGSRFDLDTKMLALTIAHKYPEKINAIQVDDLRMEYRNVKISALVYNNWP